MTPPDRQRQQVLEAYGVLDAPPRPELAAVVALAARVAGVPTATVTLVTPAGQWAVATYGVAPAVGGGADPVCGEVLGSGEPVVLPDARRDPRFRDDRSTAEGPGPIGFHASFPLRHPRGVLLGTLCVTDAEPHSVDAGTATDLATLAACVVDALELDLARRRLAGTEERLAAFAGQVGHDLRNPLSAIRMSLELARDEVADGSDLAGLLDRAERAADRLDALIGEALERTRGGDLAGPG